MPLYIFKQLVEYISCFFILSHARISVSNLIYYFYFIHEAIKTLARCFYPSMVEFFNSEEGQREYEEWLKEQKALQALPVAA